MAEVVIYIPAGEVWSFFQKNRERLTDEMVAIAEDNSTGKTVYLTEDNGYPKISVCGKEDDSLYEEGTISENDCEDTVKRCFAQYFLTPPSGDDEESDLSIESRDISRKTDLIYERDEELMLALCDFLATASNECVDGMDFMNNCEYAMLNDILDHIFVYVGEVYDIPIFRPTVLTDEVTGKETYAEYPYNDVPYEEDEEGGWI